MFNLKEKGLRNENRQGTRGETGRRRRVPGDVSMWPLGAALVYVQTFNLNSAMLCPGDLKANFIIESKKM